MLPLQCIPGSIEKRGVQERERYRREEFQGDQWCWEKWWENQTKSINNTLWIVSVQGAIYLVRRDQKPYEIFYCEPANKYCLGHMEEVSLATISRSRISLNRIGIKKAQEKLKVIILKLPGEFNKLPEFQLPIKD